MFSIPSKMGTLEEEEEEEELGEELERVELESDSGLPRPPFFWTPACHAHLFLPVMDLLMKKSSLFKHQKSEWDYLMYCTPFISNV